MLINLDEIKILITFFREYFDENMKAISKMLGNIDFYVEENGIFDNNKIPLNDDDSVACELAKELGAPTVPYFFFCRQPIVKEPYLRKSE